MSVSEAAMFCAGLVLGTGIMFFATSADLVDSDKTIAELEKKANLMPIITVDALGICKVTQGGKTYMLIDVTNETKALDKVIQKH